MYTNLPDSNGILIHIGDILEKSNPANPEFHGDSITYRVALRGGIPVSLYV